MLIYYKTSNLVAFDYRVNSASNSVIPNLQVFIFLPTFLTRVINSEHWITSYEMQQDQKLFSFQTLLNPLVYNLGVRNIINKPVLSLGSRMSTGCTISVRNAEIETNIRKLEPNLGYRMGSGYAVPVRNATIETNIRKLELNLGYRMGSSYTVPVRHATIETNISKLELSLGFRMGSNIKITFVVTFWTTGYHLGFRMNSVYSAALIWRLTLYEDKCIQVTLAEVSLCEHRDIYTPEVILSLNKKT